MAQIRTFRGLRPRPELAFRVASFPYDVVNSDEARLLAEGNSLSFLHVVKSEIDFPAGMDPYDDRIYEKAAANLEALAGRGVLIQDSSPCLYVYRQIMGDHCQTGLVTCAAVEDYEKDIIRKHERTREVKERDRIRHVEATNANTGPVFLTYRARAGIDRMISGVAEAPPAYDFVADDGIRHVFWVVDDQALCQGLVAAFAEVDFLYVADGHHRTASAARVGAFRRQANGAHDGSEEYNGFLTVLFPHEQLKILDYNRVIRDLAGLSREDFLAQAGEVFTIEHLGRREVPEGSAQSFKPEGPHFFSMYLDGDWYRLEAKPGTFPPEDQILSLDVSILQENLLAPILKVSDPRVDERIDFVGGIRGLVELEKRVDSGEWAVAFALYPTTVEQLMAVADAGKVMPPKSTWFEPKLRSGLIIHLLD